MYKSRSYTVNIENNVIDVSGLIGDNVIVIDRNGIGVKHVASFSGSQIINYYIFEFYQIKSITIGSGDYLIPIYENFVVDPRSLTVLYEFGPSPTVNTVYSLYFGDKIASYKVQSGDTDMDVRDGLKASIDALTWDVGTTVTTQSVLSNQLEVALSGDFVYPSVLLGRETFKKGYFIIYNNIYYILYEAASSTGYPVLPTIGASYAYNTLSSIPSTVESYLYEPNTNYLYTQTLTGTTTITGLPTINNVPQGQCIIDVANQKIYFDNILNFGEIIKVFTK